jgi:FKBP-type peptidyl-prolyl cis-trans isomerase
MDSLVRADKAAERRRLDSLYARSAPLRVRNWLHRHHIVAQQKVVGEGPFVRTLEAGSGVILDSGDMVQVILKLSTFDGQRIPLSKDTIWLPLGNSALPPKIDKALWGARTGAHLQLFTPTMAAFGGYPPNPAVPAYADLVFDITLLDTKAIGRAQRAGKR